MLIKNFIYAYVLAFLGLGMNLFFFIQFMDNKIYSVTIYLCSFLVMYISIHYVKTTYKPIIRKLFLMMEINFVLIIVLVISSFIYHIWNYTFLSDVTVAKLFLVLFGLGSIYVFIMFKRAVHTATKKVKNPRLISAPNKTYFEKIKEVNERLTSDKPYFVIGIDVEVEEED